MRQIDKNSSGGLQSGFSLIEVLVTIVILTFGLLGVAGLMFSGVSNVLASESTTKATQLAADMADRIRANTDKVNGGSMSATTKYARTFGATVPSSPTNMAEQDVKDWMEAITAQLPQGDGQITADNTGGNRKYTVEVRWAQCLGTLNKAETEGTSGCENNPGAAFRKVLVELRI